MSTEDRFVRQLEAYLDEYEGPTPLPESVRDAVRAAVPRTPQVGVARGAVARMAPVALAAGAVVLLAFIGVYLLGGRYVGGPGATPAPSPTQSQAVVVPSPSSEPECATSDVVSSGETLLVDWCVAHVDAPNELLSFSLVAPVSWADQYYGDALTFWLRPAGGGAIAFAFDEDQSADELLADVASRAGYVVENQAPVNVGGSEGTTFDVRLADGTTGAAPLLEAGTQDWVLTSTSSSRVWILDHDGETLVIATGAELADAVRDALETLAWTN